MWLSQGRLTMSFYEAPHYPASSANHLQKLAVDLAHDSVSIVWPNIYKDWINSYTNLFSQLRSFGYSTRPYIHKGVTIYPSLSEKHASNTLPSRPLSKDFYEEGDECIKYYKKISPIFLMLLRYFRASLQCISSIEELKNVIEPSLYNELSTTSNYFSDLLKTNAVSNFDNVFLRNDAIAPVAKKFFKSRFQMTEQAIINQIFLNQIGV